MSDIIVLMVSFAKVTNAPRPKTELSKQIATVCAGLIAVVSVVQLFFFEDFVVFMSSIPFFSFLPGLVIASLAAVFAVFSLPFLLRMPLSVAFRWLSMFFSWLTTFFWFILSILIVYGGVAPARDSAFYYLDVISGPWLVFATLGAIVMVAWASWGLWPIGLRKATK